MLNRPASGPTPARQRLLALIENDSPVGIDPKEPVGPTGDVILGSSGHQEDQHLFARRHWRHGVVRAVLDSVEYRSAAEHDHFNYARATQRGTRPLDHVGHAQRLHPGHDGANDTRRRSTHHASDDDDGALQPQTAKRGNGRWRPNISEANVAGGVLGSRRQCRSTEHCPHKHAPSPERGDDAFSSHGDTLAAQPIPSAP